MTIPWARLFQPLVDAALPIYLIVTFFRFYVDNSAFFLVATSALIALGNIYLLYGFYRSPKNCVTVFLLFFMLLFAVATAAFAENPTLDAIPQALGNAGFAWAALYARFRVRYYLALFWVLGSFFLLHIVAGSNPEGIFFVSRNFISVLIIMGIGFYYIACAQAREIPKLYVSAIGLVVALWAIGRAGIICAALILLGTLVLSKRYVIAGLLLTGVIAIGSIFVQTNVADSLEIFLVGIERFDRLGADSERNMINDEYMDRLASRSGELLVGAPLDSITAIVKVDGNPHNSYIRLHTVFGLFGFLLVVIAMGLSAIKLFLDRDYLVGLIFVIAALRSAFDSTAFYGPLDVLIFYGLFFAIGRYKLTFRSANGIGG